MKPGHRQHLAADENQHQRQAVLQQVETLGHVSQQKIQRAQTHDGEDVGREYDERVSRDRKDGRDAIDSKNQVAGLDHHQHQKHRRGVAQAVDAHKELLAVKVWRDAHVATQPAQQRVLFKVGLPVSHHQHLDSGYHQERTEDIKHPGKFRHQPDASQNHDGAHDDRPDHAVEQHAPLQLGRHRKVGEDHHEDKHVVHRQGLLDQVAGEKLQRLAVGHLTPGSAVEVPPQQGTEGNRQNHPGYHPARGLLDRNTMGLVAAEDE